MQKETAKHSDFTALKKFKVIIIEDDEGLNLLLNKQLKRAGYQTQSFFNGEEAISAIEPNTNSILLVDYKLPDMTGKELIEKLSANVHKLPYFFIMTGFGDERIAVEMMKLGARDYIIKDADFVDVLIEKLRQACNAIEEQTRLTEAEQALKESELNYRSLYENMSQGVVYQNKEGKIISANPAAERILGLSFSQMIGASSMDPAWKTVDEDGKKLPGEKHPAMVSLSTGKRVEDFLMGVYNPRKKKYTWIQVNSIPQFKEDDSKPLQVVTTFTDVTKRIEAEENLKSINQQLVASEQQLISTNQQLIANEQQLRASNQQLKATEKQLKEANCSIRESEKQFRQLFENLEQGFALHEMIYDENKKPVDYRFVLINKAFEKLTSVKASDYIGKTAKEVLPEIENLWIENYGKVAQSGKPMHFEHYSNIFNKYYNVIAYSPKKNFFATVFTDTTQEKRRIEEIVEAKQKAEKNEQLLRSKNKEIKLNIERLESLFKISQYQAKSIQDLLDFALQESISLTNSKIGYIYFYNEDTKQFTLNTWSKEVMKECAVLDPETTYDLDTTGCWGEAVRQRKPIIINDYSADNPLKKGTPEGHVELKKFLTIPVITDNKIVAVAGVANKEEDYVESDSLQLSLLMDQVWKIVEKTSLIKKLEEAKVRAEENESMLQAALENSQAGIAIADVPSGKLKFVNKAGLLIRDKDYDEIVKDIDLDKYVSSWQILDLDGTPLKTEEVPLARSVMYGETNSREFIVRRDNNEDRYVWANAAPIINESGKQIAAIVIFLDISERKKAQNEIAEQKLLFETMFNAINDAIIITDNSRKIVLANKGTKTTFGYKPEEIIGKETKILYADIEKYDEAGHKIFGKTAQMNNELFVTKFKDKNNTVFPGEIFGTRLFNAQGEWIGNLGNIRNISERLNYIKDIKEAKKLAERNEQDLKLLFDNMHQGFALHKLIYNESGEAVGFKFVRVSPSYERVTQRNISEYIGKNVFDVFPETSKKWLQIFKEIAQTGKEMQFEYYDKKIDKYYLINAFRPKPKYFGVLLTDITSIKLYEKELITAKDKAEEADRLKSAFLANMSHEIRTPMNGILGFADLLKTPGLSEEEIGSYINIIQTSGNRMLSTINDLIDISRIEAGLVEINMSNTNIHQEINYLFQFFKVEADKKGLNLLLKNKIAENDKIIQTDKQKLISILTNLIKNAIKYTNEGYIDIYVGKENDTLRIVITDTGIGIPEDRTMAIFDRFVQADIGDRRAFEGSGLGLSITKAYAEMLGGKIEVESELGKGSKFSVEIPLTSQINTEEESGGLLANNYDDTSKKLNVLIVEDDSVSARYLSILLKSIANKIDHVGNGQEAIDYIKANEQTDLIMMDIKMPVMDGYETTSIIRSFNANVKIIAQTAHALEDDKLKALNAGCSAYISKPINKAALFQVIENCFN